MHPALHEIASCGCLSVLLDKKWYYPGDMIEGIVRVRPDENMKAKAVKLTFRGVSYAELSAPHSNYNEDNAPTSTTNIIRESSTTLWSASSPASSLVTFATRPSDANAAAPDLLRDNMFSFSLALPSNCPPSLDLATGYIGYEISVLLSLAFSLKDLSLREDPALHFFVPVKPSPRTIARLPEYSLAAPVDVRTMRFLRHGDLGVQLRLDSNLLSLADKDAHPGLKTLKGTIMVENRSTKVLRSLDVGLTFHLRSQAGRSSYVTKDTCGHAIIYEGALSPGQTSELIPFSITPTKRLKPTGSFSNHTIQYLLRFKAVLGTLIGTEVKIKVPIEVANVHVDENQGLPVAYTAMPADAPPVAAAVFTCGTD